MDPTVAPILSSLVLDAIVVFFLLITLNSNTKLTVAGRSMRTRILSSLAIVVVAITLPLAVIQPLITKYYRDNNSRLISTTISEGTARELAWYKSPQKRPADIDSYFLSASSGGDRLAQITTTTAN